MDPYVEVTDVWEDFHFNLACKIHEQIADLAPDRYCIRIGVREYVLGEEEHSELFVNVFADAPHRCDGPTTVVEILSPWNKRDKVSRDLYLQQRQGRHSGGINLVEIDLLRGGEKMPLCGEYPKCPYTLLVARADQTQAGQVTPAHFRQPLPALPIPLAPPDADLTLPLQPIIEGIYYRSRDDDTIDYTKPLSPALDEEDATW